MKLPKLVLMLMCVSLQAMPTARADEFLGAILGDSNGGKEASLTAGVGAIEAPNHPDPSDIRDHAKEPWYGQFHTRLELGLGIPKVAGDLGIGFHNDITFGRELIDLSKPTRFGYRNRSGAVGLHLGAVGVSNANVNSDDDRTDYIEIGPMISLGVQAEYGKCLGLVGARVGASVGTLGQEGLRPAYGAEADLVCKGLKATGEWQHIRSERASANIGTFEIKRVKTREYVNKFWGIRGEMINTRHDRSIPDNTGADKNEYRVLVTAGAAIL